MATVQTVYDIAMSLIDERLDSGSIDPTSTAVFAKNTPYILTSLQDELIQHSDYYKTTTITVTSAVDTAGHYIAHTMPSDFQVESQIVEIETGGTYRGATDFRWEGKNTLLVPDTFVGTIKIVYLPIPAALTTMASEMVLDDITCRTTLAYGLASRLLTNENKVLANYFNDLYNELKSKPRRRKLATAQPILDKYDSTLTH